MYIHFEAVLPAETTIFIDNAEVIRRGTHKVPRLGIKQQLVLDYDLWATTERLQDEILCNIKWKWVKGHQTQGQGSKWKLEVAVNNFCDTKAEEASSAPSLGGGPFFPDQQIGITWNGERQHGSPRQAILMAMHDNNLRDYICKKAGWTSVVFDSVDWGGLERYLDSITAVQRTNAIKMTHNWIHDGYQKDLFATDGEAHLCPAECRRQEAHQHYISCYAPQMTNAKAKYLRDIKKTVENNKDYRPYQQSNKVYNHIRHA